MSIPKPLVNLLLLATCLSDVNAHMTTVCTSTAASQCDQNKLVFWFGTYHGAPAAGGSVPGTLYIKDPTGTVNQFPFNSFVSTNSAYYGTCPGADLKQSNVPATVLPSDAEITCYKLPYGTNAASNVKLIPAIETNGACNSFPATSGAYSITVTQYYATITNAPTGTYEVWTTNTDINLNPCVAAEYPCQMSSSVSFKFDLSVASCSAGGTLETCDDPLPVINNVDQGSLVVCNGQFSGYICNPLCSAGFESNGYVLACDSAGRWTPGFDCVPTGTGVSGGASGGVLQNPALPPPPPSPSPLGPPLTGIQNDDWASQLGVIITNNRSSFPHTVDGKFTGWDPNGNGDHEWSDITPAKGRYTNAYFDYDGERLHILNDWTYNTEQPVLPDCYNLFTAWTGGGTQRWELKVYGDARVELTLNGEAIEQDALRAEGAVGNATSPFEPNTYHSIFELSFAAAPGSFGVQLKDPGPAFTCEVLEEDPVKFVGTVGMNGGSELHTVDTTEWNTLQDALPQVNYCQPNSPADCTPLAQVLPTSDTNTDYQTGLQQKLTNAKSAYPHTVDGMFTGFVPGSGEPNYEWSDITPAKGRFTNAYFDYDGTYLHIMNDWIYNDVHPVLPHCYNLFTAWTAGGSERWTLKVFGNRHVEVELNGELVDAQHGALAMGAITTDKTSPLKSTPHAMFELSFKASPGGYGVQLHDPGPRFGCEVVEEEPNKFVGDVTSGGGSDVTPIDDAEWQVEVDNLPTLWCSTECEAEFGVCCNDGPGYTMCARELRLGIFRLGEKCYSGCTMTAGMQAHNHMNCREQCEIEFARCMIEGGNTYDQCAQELAQYNPESPLAEKCRKGCAYTQAMQNFNFQGASDCSSSCAREFKLCVSEGEGPSKCTYEMRAGKGLLGSHCSPVCKISDAMINYQAPSPPPFPPVHECSHSCEREFHNCHAHKDAATACSECRNEIDTQVGPLKDAGCSIHCLSTPDMLALCPSS